MLHRYALLAALVVAGTAALPPAASAQRVTTIPGYTYGQESVAKAPYSLKDLESLEDDALLRRRHSISAHEQGHSR